jgi:hypothetical protein
MSSTSAAPPTCGSTSAELPHRALLVAEVASAAAAGYSSEMRTKQRRRQFAAVQ